MYHFTNQSVKANEDMANEDTNEEYTTNEIRREIDKLGQEAKVRGSEEHVSNRQVVNGRKKE